MRKCTTWLLPLLPAPANGGFEMKLYHGTSAARLPEILKEGLKPRGRGAGNWKHTIESNPNYVYLTNAYAIHFAAAATKTGDMAVIEVDVSPLNLAADEDFLEQVSRKEGPAPIGASMNVRTKWYRKRLDAYAHHWEDSLKGLGNCTHKGPIEPVRIIRTATFTQDAFARMVMSGVSDPTITLLNYALLKGRYQDSIRWLFGDPQENFDVDRTGITVNAVEHKESV